MVAISEWVDVVGGISGWVFTMVGCLVNHPSGISQTLSSWLLVNLSLEVQ